MGTRGHARATACGVLRIPWIINTCALRIGVYDIYHRATRGLQPFARVCAAGPCRRRRLTSGLPSSCRTHTPAYVMARSNEPVVGCRQVFERAICSFNEACSCVGQSLSVLSTSVVDSSFPSPESRAGSRSASFGSASGALRVADGAISGASVRLAGATSGTNSGASGRS